MPEAKFPTPELNLLSGDELENQVQGKFLKWALTWGKRIVVMTELIVILVFLSRFWLDTQVADLNEEINRKKAIVQSWAEFETKFRVVAGRLEKAQNIEQSPSVLAALDLVNTLIPQATNVSSISISRQGVSFGGSSSETVLAELVESFRGSADFKDVNVQKIAKKGTTQEVDFSFQVAYAQQPVKPVK